MMYRLLLLWACSFLLGNNSLCGQKISDAKSHEYFIKQIEDAEVDYYERIVEEYEDYLMDHPEDVQVWIEKCKFIDKAMYDEYEEYNPNYEAYDECFEFIEDYFSDNTYAKIFVALNSYGEESIDARRKLIREYESGDLEGEGLDIAPLYEQLGYDDFYESNYEKAAQYFDRALEIDTTLSIQYYLAKCYSEIGENEKAYDMVMAMSDTSNSDFVVIRNAKILLNIDYKEEALAMLNEVDYSDDESDEYKDYEAIADILVAAGEIKEARGFLLKDHDNSFYKNQSAQKLFDYDLEYGFTDSLGYSYDRMVGLSWTNDPIGIQRIKLLFDSPTVGWSWYGIRSFMLFIGAILICFILPYLWVLPIPYVGQFLSKRNFNTGQPTFDFGLRHFWYASFAFLWVSFLVMGIFSPLDLSYIFSDDYYFGDEDDSYNFAVGFWFIILMAVSTALISFQKLRKVIFRSVPNVTSYLLPVIGYFILLKVMAALSSSVFNLNTEVFDQSYSIIEDIVAFIERYGVFGALVLVAVIVPIYEEVIFRGIILSSAEKYLPYGLANVFQSILFALVHEDLGYFLFYFSMGLVAGMFTKRSGGLVVPILLHALNNGIAIFAIYAKYV